METLEQPIFPNFLDELPCSQPVYHASRQVLPGSAKAAKMTVGSGRQCSMLLDQSTRLGRFSKILLGSSLWTNSEEYCYVWNRLDTRFACSAFQLMPLGQNTGETESSLLLQTPNTFDSLEVKSQEALDHEKEMGLRTGRNRRTPNNLRDQIAVRAGMRLWRTPTASDVTDQVLSPKLWPTPTVADAEGGGSFTPTSAERLATGGCSNLRDTVKQKLWPTPRKEGYDAQGKGHGDLVYEVKARLYPTPTKSMATTQDMEQARYAGNGNRPEYKDAKLYPTPTVQCGKNSAGPSQHNHNSDPLDVVAAKMSGQVSGSLNPRFVEELMGYEIDHTALKHSATPSFRSKPTRSSKQSPKPKASQ